MSIQFGSQSEYELDADNQDEKNKVRTCTSTIFLCIVIYITCQNRNERKVISNSSEEMCYYSRVVLGKSYTGTNELASLPVCGSTQLQYSYSAGASELCRSCLDMGRHYFLTTNLIVITHQRC